MQIKTDYPPLFDTLADLYPLAQVESDETIVHFRVRMRQPRGFRRLWRPQIRFHVEEGAPFEPYPLNHAFPMLEWGINWCIAMRSHQYLLLHAGVVERGGRGLILAGTPGSGKSTLTAALAWRGWRLLADEFGLLRRPEGDLLPLPRAIALKNASIEVIRAFAPEAYLGPVFPKTRKGDLAHMRPPDDSLLRQGTPAEPRWIVFPRFQSGRALRFERVADSLAFTRLAHNCFNYRMLGEAGFRALSALIRRCECYSLAYGDLDTATDVLRRLASEGGAATGAMQPTRRPTGADSGLASRQQGAPECSGPGPSPGPGPGPGPGSTAGGRVPGGGLLRALADPDVLGGFSVGQWDRLLREARFAGVLGSLSHLAADHGIDEYCPPPARDILEAARHYPALLQTQARQEIRHILRALGARGPDLILLKGVAYTVAGLPLARGRLLADADILVQRRDLPAVEERLLACGWRPAALDGYDQRYYREWMHEIPPLKHRARGFEVDVHHALLPLTARVRPDPALLWDASVPIDGGPLRVLAPADMLLHSAAHLFYGEIDNGLRELLDLHLMLTDFGRAEGFWDVLPDRAACLQLTRPLFYALRYCQRFFGTRIPAPVMERVAHLGAPGPAARVLIDRLVGSVLTPRVPEEPGPTWSARLLYARSHWLRMPPGLLARHLSRKALRRFKAAGSPSTRDG